MLIKRYRVVLRTSYKVLYEETGLTDQHPHDIIREAITRGVKALLCEDVLTILEPDSVSRLFAPGTGSATREGIVLMVSVIDEHQK